MTQRLRLLLIVGLLTLVAGNVVLLDRLHARGYALRLVRYDRTGGLFEAAPDASMRMRHDGFVFDYAMGMNPERSRQLELPRATGGDGGLDDVRNDIVWIQSRFRAGGFYGIRPWKLEEALQAARDPNRRFYCFSYAAAMVSLCESQGYPARLVSIGGHLTSAVYLPALRQWVLADALHRVIPHGPDGRPLSTVQASLLLRRGGSIDWRRIPGVPDDRPETFDRAAFESMLRRGDFVVSDGPTTFGLRGLLGRVADLATGRARILQLALDGQPPIDASARRIRTVLALWNLAGAVALISVTRLAASARG